MGNAARMLQRAVGVVADGAIGPYTLQAVKAMPVGDVLALFNAERLEFYTQISSFKHFGKGWVRRVAENLRYVAQDI